MIVTKFTTKLLRHKDFAIPRVKRLGGKPARTGDDMVAAAKERPEEAPFTALRPHN